VGAGPDVPRSAAELSAGSSLGCPARGHGTCRRLDSPRSGSRIVLRGDAHPSIWTAFRTADPSGVSPGTWWIGIAEAFLWGYYGWFWADIGILTFSAVGVVGSVLMLARYHSTRSQVELATELKGSPSGVTSRR